MTKPNKREMTWAKDKRQWKKMIGGEVRFLGPKGKGKSDAETYRLALVELRKWQAEIEEAKQRQEAKANPLYQALLQEEERAREQAAHDTSLAIHRKAAAGHYPESRPGHFVVAPEDVAVWKAKRAELENFQGNEDYSHNVAIASLVSQFAKLLTIPEIAQAFGQAPKAVESTDNPSVKVSDMLEGFLAYQTKRYNTGKSYEKRRENGENVKPAKHEVISFGRLSKFKTWVEKCRALFADRPWDKSEQGGTAVMEAVRDYATGLFASGSMEANTFNDFVVMGKLFIEWAYETGKLDNKPRNMAKLTARHAPKLTAETIPLDVIRKLWATADDGERVFLSLALNCALKSKEISDLLKSGLVDGYLSHTRVKTGVPSVWKLWAVTLELIQRTSNGTKRIFEHNGKGLNDCGEGGHGDKIGKQFAKLCERAGVTGYSFENLRDTSSTVIAAKYGESSHIHKAFLAHSNKDNTKHYVDYNDPSRRDVLTEAVAYLDGHYGLTLEANND